MKKIGLLLIATFCIGTTSFSQSLDTAAAKPVQHWLKKNGRFTPELKSMVQLWGIHSHGMEVYDADTKQYAPVDDRFNLSLRRVRFVVSGEPYVRLSYTVAFFYDQIGRDVLSSGVGASNKADPAVGIWDAFFTWKIAKNEAFCLTSGWFRPQMQRESITSGWATTSFEKSMSQNYVRTHLVGAGPGRAMGVNLGGLLGKGKFHLNYNLGLFNPVTASLSGTSGGVRESPLVAGRASLWLGDPEFSKYGISYDINFYSKRKGISLDFNASHQGETDAFESSTAIGPGLLINWGPVNLDGEWIWLDRSDGQTEAQAATGHLRLGVNVPTGRFLLEPTFMVMKFRGEMTAGAQSDAAALKMQAGEESTFDAGVNWYLDKKNLKLALHYTWRSGSAGDAGDGSQVNAYFSQGGVGAIHRGNYAGIGISSIF